MTMEREVFEYRQTHPKCRYCKHLKYIADPMMPYNTQCYDYYECKAKDVEIKHISIPRYFCSCYIVKE